MVSWADSSPTGLWVDGLASGDLLPEWLYSLWWSSEESASWVLWTGLLLGALMLGLSVCCPEDLGAEGSTA